jgi:hypothetical protein
MIANETEQAAEFDQVIPFEGGEPLADDVETHPRHPLEETSPGLGQGALDDAPVIRAVTSFDQSMAFDAGDEPGRGGRTEVEDLGDPTHRLGSLAKEKSKQPDLTEGEVAGGDRRDVARHEVERGEHRLGGYGQRLITGD